MGRYLLAASPLDGHVMPMVSVGADLCERGHRVDFLTAAGYHHAVRAGGMRPLTLPPRAHPRRRSPRPAVLPNLVQRWRAGRTDLRDVFIAPLAAQHEAVQNQLSATDYDAVLCDVGFTGVLPMLLTARARPVVLVCGVGPLTLSSSDTPPFGIGWQPVRGRNYTAMNWVVQRVFFADVQARLNRVLRRLDAPAAPVFLTDWPVLADRLLQFSVPSLEYPRRDLPASVTFTGPVFPRPARSAKNEWHGVVQRPGTLVHVTQGTWHNRDLSRLIRPTISAFAGHPDISVVATTGRPGVDVRVDATNVHVTDFIPYGDLLPQVDVMITNGGYGGVHHALAYGIPLVVAADDADKPEIAARVAYCGAGIDLGTARPTSSQLAAAVDRVRSDDRYRGAALALSRELNATRPLEVIAGVLEALEPSPTRR